MSSTNFVLDGAWAQAVGWALTHFVWQGALVAAALWMAGPALRARSSSARYGAACAALFAMFALFAGTVAYLAAGADDAAASASFAASESIVAAETASPAAADMAGGAAGAEATAFDARTTGAGGIFFERALARTRAAVDDWLPVLLAAWLAGVIALSLRFAGGWVVAERLKRRHVTPAAERWQQSLDRLCAEMRVSPTVRLCESAIAEVPSVVGWLAPVILIPSGAFVGLAPRQIEAILAHELAHVRRHDYLVNLLQTAVETLLFYHPAVWWVSKRVRAERENCCDDAAVAACGGDVVLYARALVELEALRPAAAPRLAVAATGGDLLHRIERLLAPAAADSARGESSPPAASGVVALSLVAALVFAPGAPGAPTSARAADAPQDPASPQSTRRGEGDGRTPRARLVRSEQQEAPQSPDADAQPGPDGDPSTADFDAEVDLDVGVDVNVDANVDTYVDSASFAATAARGFGDPNLAATDAEFAAAVAGAGYPGLDDSHMHAFRVHGVTPAYVEQMRATGLTPLEPDDLIAMRIHGVTPDFVRELRSSGYGRTAQSLIAMRIHGVTPDFVRGLAAAGYQSLSHDQVVAFRIHGITPDLVSGLADAGYRNLPESQLLAFRVHGVTPEFVRELASSGYANVAANRLVTMRVHGVTPAFVREIKSLGYAPTADELVTMRVHGVTPEFVRGVAKRGIRPSSVRELITMKIAGYSN